MTSIVTFMTADHRACDAQFAEIERLVATRSWPQAAAALRRFAGVLRCHFAREEEVLFPAFEQAAGHRGGPTMVMRMEHEQMRALLSRLDGDLLAQDDKRFLSMTDSLMVLMQQHNMKEEQILYPMCEQMLADAAGTCARLSALQPEPD